MIRRTVIAFSVMVATLFFTAAARSGLSLADVRDLSLPLAEIGNSFRAQSPATMLLRDSIAVSTAEASWDWEHGAKPLMTQLGTGRNSFSLSAASFRHLGQRSAVWGEAEFTTSRVSDVRWNDCLDYLRVAPYVLGDAVGGSLSDRRYQFSGGYAASAGRWSFGGEIAYRAEIAYRDRDPRIKTVVSDLDVAAGLSFALSDRYVLGVKAALNIYSQNCDLDFYNPTNDINTYTLTGLGTYYRRFMGNTNKNSGYESLACAFGLQWQPTASCGFFASADVLRYRMDQRLRNYNNITLGFTENNLCSLRAAYIADISSDIKIAPEVGCEIFTRRGTENLFGSSSGAGYDKIGSRSPYSLDVRNAYVSLPVQLSLRSSHLTLSPKLAWTDSKESYTDPVRKISVTRLAPGLSADFSVLHSRNWLAEYGLSGTFATVVGKECRLDEVGEDDLPIISVEENFRMQSADCLSLSLSAKVSRRLDSGIILSLRIAGTVADYRDTATRKGLTLSLGATF